MTLTDKDIEEFLALCEEEDGVRPSREVALEAAARVVLLYERLLLPTPEEIRTAHLAKSRSGGSLTNGPVEPNKSISIN